MDNQTKEDLENAMHTLMTARVFRVIDAFTVHVTRGNKEYIDRKLREKGFKNVEVCADLELPHHA